MFGRPCSAKDIGLFAFLPRDMLLLRVDWCELFEHKTCQKTVDKTGQKLVKRKKVQNLLKIN